MSPESPLGEHFTAETPMHLGNSDENITGAGRTRLNPQRLGLPKLRVRGQGGMFGTSTPKTAFGTIYVGQNKDSVLESRIKLLHKYGIVISFDLHSTS